MIAESVELAVRHRDNFDHILGLVHLGRVRAQALKAAKTLVFLDPCRQGRGLGGNAEFFIEKQTGLLKRAAEVVVAHPLDNHIERKVLAFDVLRGKGLAAIGIAAQIEPDNLVYVFTGASFNKIFGLAVGAGFCAPLPKLTRPSADIACALGRSLLGHRLNSIGNSGTGTKKTLKKVVHISSFSSLTF